MFRSLKQILFPQLLEVAGCRKPHNPRINPCGAQVMVTLVLSSDEKLGCCNWANLPLYQFLPLH